MNLNKEKIINISIILAAAVGAIIFGFLVIAPLWSEIGKINSDIKIAEGEKIAHEQRLSDLKELEGNYEDAKVQTKGISTVLPTEKKLEETIVQLETLANNNGIAFRSISTSDSKTSNTSAQPNAQATVPQTTPTTNTSPTDYKEVPFTINLSGLYPALKNYMIAFEKNQRIFDVISIDIKKQDKTNALLVTIKVKAYVQNPSGAGK